MRLGDEGAGEEGSRQKEQPVLRRNCEDRAEGDGRAQVTQGLGSQLEMLCHRRALRRGTWSAFGVNRHLGCSVGKRVSPRGQSRDRSPKPLPDTHKEHGSTVF